MLHTHHLEASCPSRVKKPTQSHGAPLGEDQPGARGIEEEPGLPPSPLHSRWTHVGINQDPTLGTPSGAARKQAYAGAESVTSLRGSTPAQPGAETWALK